jgi:RimJ/RimL family protein N-acetyltransferase
MAAVSLAPVVTVERLTRLERTDLEDLCDAAGEAITSGGGFGWLKPPSRHVFEAYWKGVLMVPERELFVGRLDGTIAGSVQLVRPTRNNEAQALTAQLTANFVAPWARRHGLARRILQAAESAATAAGMRLLNLDIRETQTAAIQLCEALGFTRWGVHPCYARVDDQWVRGFHYFKKIGEERGL